MSTSALMNWSIDVAPASTPTLPVPELPRAESASSNADEREPVKIDRIRRWESAETNRVNAAQWCDVHVSAINDDLAADLTTLVARCRYERFNNPMVEGVVETYATDVVGENGPHLIVESDNEDFDAVYMENWQKWFDHLCVDGMSGVDLLNRLVGQDFTDGDWLHQIVNMDEYLPASEPVKCRLLDIDPRRLVNPLTHMMTDNIVEGIRRNRFGIPTEYFIREPEKQFGPSWLDFTSSLSPTPTPAEDIIHVFHSREPGQVRGFPRLASCLQEMAELRDFDQQVLDTARVQANNGMLLYTKDPLFIGSDPKPFTGKISLERQTAKAVPPGYEVAGQSSTQPGAHYIDFRHEKLRSLGRLVNMPLLMILLSAEDSNFSQSRIDINVIYQRGLKRYQKWIETNWLKILLHLFDREMRLAVDPSTSRMNAQFLLPPRPKKISFSWGWEPMGQANPKDHVAAQIERIRWGLTSPAIELADEGRNEDTILQSLARTNEKRKRLNLPPIPGPETKVTNEENEQNKTPPAGPKKATQSKQKRRATARAFATST